MSATSATTATAPKTKMQLVRFLAPARIQLPDFQTWKGFSTGDVVELPLKLAQELRDRRWWEVPGTDEQGNARPDAGKRFPYVEFLDERPAPGAGRTGRGTGIPTNDPRQAFINSPVSGTGAADSEAIRALEETASNIRQLQRETIAQLAQAREELAAQEKRAVKSGRWATKELQAARAQVTDLESTLRVADEAIRETLIEIRQARGQHWDAELVRLRGEYRTALQGTEAKALAFLAALEELQRLEGEAHRTLGGDEFPQLGRSMLIQRLRLWLENADGALKKVEVT